MTTIAEGGPAYVETAGRTATMQRDYDGKQPGDPARAAQAILSVVSAKHPPLRLVLGADAYARAERTDEARLAELRAWRETILLRIPHAGLVLRSSKSEAGWRATPDSDDHYVYAIAL